MKKTEAIDKNGKVWTIDEIRNLLLTNDVAVCRAVVRITQYQTEVEKQAEATINRNNVGFTGSDGRLASFAKFYNDKGFMTPKQIAYVRKRIVKYSGQLIRIMRGAQ